MKVNEMQAKKETLTNQLNSLRRLLHKVSKGKQERLSYAQEKNVSVFFRSILNDSDLFKFYLVTIADSNPILIIEGVKD